MTAIRINPMVVSVSPTDTTLVQRIAPTQHGGGVKKVIAVVAAVAIPIAAPAIASSIVGSGVLGAAVSAAASTTVGAVASSAIVGAGLGAITAKVTGGDVKTGAITGALGGALGGYGVAKSTGAGLGNVNQTGIKATADRVLGTNFTGQATTTTPTAADPTQVTTTDASGSTLAQGPQGVDTTLANDPTATTLAQGTTAPVDSATAALNAPDVVQASLTTPVATPPVIDPATGAVTKASLGERFMAAVTKVPSQVATRLTDPDALANLTIQAGGQLLGQALAPDPTLPPEQLELLNLRKQELQDLKEKDEEAFNAQMDAARQYLRQAEQFNPVYMAQQAANKEAIKQGRGLREQYRKAALSGGRNISAAERRRMELDAARNVSSSYDQGYQQGMTSQNKVTQAGLSAIPNSGSYANYANALQGLEQDQRLAQNAALTRSATAAKNISDLFAGFNTSASNTDEMENELNQGIGGKKAGLNTTNALS